MAVNLTAQQQGAVEDRGGNLLVSAAAGSGKTKVLVERLFRYVLEEGRNIDEFLIITYTRAAAAELRSRIAGDLGKQLAQRPGDYHLQQQLYRIYRADIKTVDSFCSALLRENIHLLQTGDGPALTADFRVLEEGEADLLRQRVLARTLEQFYGTMEEGDGSSQLADAYGFGRDDRALEELVLRMSEKLQSHAYPDKWLREMEAMWQNLPDSIDDTPYAAVLKEALGRKADHWQRQLRQCVTEMAGEAVLEKAYCPGFLHYAEGLGSLANAGNIPWDQVSAAVPAAERLKPTRNVTDELLKNRMAAVWKACKEEVKRAAEVFAVSDGEAMEDLRAVAPAMCALLKLTEDYEHAYQLEKRRRNAADFSDQEHYAIQLLLGEDGTPTDLCRQVGARYAEIMVDEYQDTNEVQNCIFEALAAGRNNLFCVGDVKQSIYRFRLADPTIFLEKYRRFRPKEEAEKGEDRKILLSKNFRSRGEVLDAANFVFSNILSQEMGEMDYGPDEALYFGAEYYPEAEDRQPEFHLLQVPAGDEGGDTHWAEARFVAEKIAGMLQSGFQVLDEGGAMRPCRSGDFAVLMRSPSQHLYQYIAALRERGIPCAVQENEDFFAAMEVAVAINLLAVVDNPHQDVPLISVLRSPVFGFTPDRLAEIRGNCPAGDYCTALERAAERGEEDAAAVEDALAGLRSAAKDMSVQRLLWHIYNELNLPGVFGAMDNGAARRENLVTLGEWARSFESGGYRGLFAFVSHLRQLLESGSAPTGSGAAAGEGVQIMTIHKSKGLEFPIVILADLSKEFNRTDLNPQVLVHPRLGLGPRRIDLDRRLTYPTLARTAVERQLSREGRSEEMRVLYVAMTRPKEKLIMVASGKRMGSKMKKLLPLAGCPAEPNAVEAASCLADWVLLPLLCRPEAAVLRDLGEMDVPQLVTGGVTWTVAAHDGASYTRPAGAGREDVPVTPRQEPDFDPALLDFVYPYPQATVLPTKVTATQLKGRDKDAQIAEGAGHVYQPAEEFSAPLFLQKEEKHLTPSQRGTAVHAVMQYIDFACPDAGKAIAALVADKRLTAEQGAAIDPKEIDVFLRSALAREIRSARRVWREYTFSLLMPGEDCLSPGAAGEEVLLQGVVDCFFDTPEGLVVVDFKTDRVSGKEQKLRTEHYRSQVAAYSAALTRIFGRPVARQVLYYFHTGTTVEL